MHCEIFSPLACYYFIHRPIQISIIHSDAEPCPAKHPAKGPEVGPTDSTHVNPSPDRMHTCSLIPDLSTCLKADHKIHSIHAVAHHQPNVITLPLDVKFTSQSVNKYIAHTHTRAIRWAQRLRTRLKRRALCSIRVGKRAANRTGKPPLPSQRRKGGGWGGWYKEKRGQQTNGRAKWHPFCKSVAPDRITRSGGGGHRTPIAAAVCGKTPSTRQGGPLRVAPTLSKAQPKCTSGVCVCVCVCV